ncbi:multidrug resistance-associated protein 1 [Biomphalaria pfeifferi]|uniref:ABC-type glutathione-S-conjugate transporter n=1 Tax=Biomphalaria pfeifferi TaxID=112525 RepID=A0AAD8AUP1_BIOPF|nr:multidrug resistance-associated protein 1 [Biomphalaria pfeifferi]
MMELSNNLTATSLNGFCVDPFWDEHLTWESQWPQFTECFIHTVLVWIPCGWLWLSAPVYIWYIASRPASAPKNLFSWLFLLKLLFLCSLIVLSGINILTVVTLKKYSGEDYFKADFLDPLLMTFTLVAALILVILERKKNFVTSGVLFIFWLLLILSNIVNFYTYIESNVYSQDKFAFIVFYMQYFMYLIEFFLHCFAENVDFTSYKEKQPCPELSASFPSRVSFWWLERLMKQGYKEPITEQRLPDLQPKDRCQIVIKRFLNCWIPALAASKAKSRLKVTHQKEPTERTRLVASGGDVSVIKKKPLGPSLLYYLFIKAFGVDLLISQAWKLFYDILLLTNPLLLGELVDFVSSSSLASWHGYILAVALFTSTVLQSFLFHQLFHHSCSLGLRMRASLISSVFRKSLTMDNQARKESTIGEVVNLMSVDASNIESVMSYLWAIWSSPLQITVSLYLLYNVLGISMFAGAAFLVLLIPANGVISSKMGTFQTQLMAFKDQRLKMMNELLTGMKIVKLFAWEKSFEKKILDVRNNELLKLRGLALISSITTLSWGVAPYIVSLLTFLTYVYISDDHYLDPKTAFVAISLFDILRYAINFAPMILSDVIKAYISARRIEKFLSHDDLNTHNVRRVEQADHAITIENGTFKWNPDGPVILKNINISIEDGSLVGVVGVVGSGKSSLLSAMLGDLEKVEGQVILKGKVAYVSQQAWIQNDTLRNNILFGKPLMDKLYSQCLDACALRPDLEILAAGDMTEIGERGINLSGGQKQRVALARAVYAQADIYLLDDPLSAVDAHVGQHIFDNVIGAKGLLAGKVRVLVTHRINYLPFTDHILVMTAGEISENGRYDELMSHRGPFSKLIATYMTQENEAETSSIESSDAKDKDDEESSTASKLLRRLSSSLSHEVQKKHSFSEHVASSTTQQNEVGNLIDEETVAIGRVPFNVYKKYGRSLGYFFVLLLIALYMAFIATFMWSSVFLRQWTDDVHLGNFTDWPNNSTERKEKNDFYITIYGVFGICQVFFLLGFSITLSFRSVHASRRLHGSMLDSVLHAPMQFFDTTPIGRIMNRFSKDLDDVDESIPWTLHMGIDCFFQVLAVLIIISYSTPFFLAFLLPVGAIYFFVQRYFVATSRQLKRLGAKTTSPIFNHFSETLAGATTVRAFGAEQRFIKDSDTKVDLNQICKLMNYTCNRWLGVRLEFLGNLIILLAAIIAVATKDSISAGIMGLSISFALQITTNLNWLVRMISDLETQVVSVERIVEYSELQPEAAWEIDNNTSPAGWPQSGHVSVENLSLRYREGLDLVLKRISFEVKTNEKVGIVGRTGAGKSSLTLAFFRLVEPAEGRILIDGIDIMKLGLHELRMKVTIIPQDPLIFAGTLRENLDPFKNYDDEAVWVALEHSHLKLFVESHPDKLQHQCGEGGMNLSVGQRQLLCMARALLRKTKILILDEATAAVDMETDELIQATIRNEFSDCTILTIAHRLNTVMDYDRILVLDQGEIKEYDSPQKLLENQQSIFYSMAKTAGIVT